MFDCIAYGIDSPGWPVSATLESFFKTESDAITWARLYFADGNGDWEYIAIPLHTSYLTALLAFNQRK